MNHTSPARLSRITAIVGALAVGIGGLAVPSTAFAAGATVSASWLDGYFTETAIGDAGTSYADFDELGSYLVRAPGQGVTPDVTHELASTGLTYSIAGAVPGDADNLIAAGQTIDTSRALGSLAAEPATRIAFIGASGGGQHTVNATLSFSDGSNQVITVMFSDWCDPAPQGSNVGVGKWSQRWFLGSAQTLSCGLWGTEVYTLQPTAPGSTLESITWGNDPKFHVFGIAGDAEVSAAAITVTGSGAVNGAASASTYSPAGVTITASGNPVWSPSGVTASYRWLVDGVVVPGARAATYAVQPGDVGKPIAVAMTARKAGYVSGAVTSNPVMITPGALVQTAAPALSGTASVGHSLSASAGTYTPSAPEMSYSWFADGEQILGASSSSLTVGPTEVGKSITAQVTATALGYAPFVTTLGPSAPVIPSTFHAIVDVTVDGTARVGGTLRAIPGAYDVPGVTETFVWTANGTAIPGATSTVLVVPAAQAGAAIAVRATASRLGYRDVVTVVSAGTASALPLVVTGVPRISSGVVGAVASVAPGRYNTPGVTETYQWFVAGAAVRGATSVNYTPVGSDAGRALTVRTTASKPGYATVTTTTAPLTVKVGTIVVKKKPAIKKAKKAKKVKVGKKLKATKGKYSAAPVKLKYQWYRGSKKVKGKAAKRAKYTIVKADKRKKLKVKVTVKATGYSTVKLTTKKTIKVR